MMTIKFGRRSVSMGDDVDNGIYDIQMPDDATLADLIHIVLHGGNGNTWPIPSTTTVWNICSNIGMIALIGPEKKEIDFLGRDGSEPLSALGIQWVYGGHEEPEMDIALLERSHFR